jgi:hypothetical protein
MPQKVQAFVGSLFLLVCVGRTSFGDDSHSAFKRKAAPERTSTAAASAQSQGNTTPVNPHPGGVTGGVTPWSSAASAGSKLASTWTLEERLANRCNPLKAEERARQSTQANSRLTSESLPTTNAADVISGRTHPELFLPHELFEEVVRDAAFRPGFPSFYRPRVEAAGLPTDFWNRLESLSAAYIRDLREQDNRGSDKSVAGRALAIARWSALDRQTCHDGALALRSARAAFGAPLDHFMYEYIAPDTTARYDEVPDERTLRSREGGCE